MYIVYSQPVKEVITDVSEKNIENYQITLKLFEKLLGWDLQLCFSKIYKIR